MWDMLPRALAPHVRPIAQPRDRLNVEAARAVPIREAAARLGIVANRAGLARCPFHDDRRPSLHLNDKKGAAFCNPCSVALDSIGLTMAVRGIPFRDAVQELVA